jgi:hypothetical protein
MGNSFWVKLEGIVVKVIPEKKNLQYVLYILEVISSYRLSLEFIRKYFIEVLR